jgi:hypothetical protein
MPNIRLRQDQIDRLRRTAGAYVINSAIERYDAGEIKIVVQKRSKRRKGKNVLRVYSTRNERALELYKEGKIQAVLDAHWNNPVDHSKQIDLLDKQIEAMFKLQPEYIINEE